MKHFLLIYDVSDDYLQRRGEFRAEHIANAWAAAERGELVMAGALADPVDSTMFLFLAESPAPAEAFATVDPYVTNGLVKRWRVREWMTVAGPGAANPIRP